MAHTDLLLREASRQPVVDSLGVASVVGHVVDERLAQALNPLGVRRRPVALAQVRDSPLALGPCDLARCALRALSPPEVAR